MILSPRWLGDIFDNHMDISATIIYAILMYLAVQIFLSSKKTHWKELFVFTIISSIAFSHRTILVSLPIIFSICYMVSLRKKHRIKCLAIRFSMYIFLFFSVLFLIDPTFHELGFLGIFLKFFYSAKLIIHRFILFEGTLYYSRHLPWYYLPKWIFITTPLVIIFCFMLGCFSLIRRQNIFDGSRQLSIFLLMTFFLPVIFVIILSPTLYNGWRHFLFLSVPLVIIATLGIQYLQNSKLAYSKTFLTIFILGNALFVLKDMHALHPYEYIYFNEIIGGVKGAYGKYEMDYWGKSYQEATKWLIKNELTSKKQYLIKTCGDKLSSTYYFLPTMHVEPNREKADYFICNPSDLEFDLGNKYKTLFIVTREGIPLSYVKKIQ
jgi:hypothetical protein